MPWLDKVSAVLEAWYPGIRGGEAIAAILFGDVNPSAKLPVTFPRAEADLPHPTIPGPPPQPAQQAPAPGAGARGGFRTAPFDIPYTEGLKVGYKWFEAEDKQPLFTFGYGLSYTSVAYSGLKVSEGPEVKVTFTVKNTGKRSGAEVAQVYVTLPASAGEPFKRLVAWDKVRLAAGESKTVSLTLEPLHLSIFSTTKDDWEVVAGEYKLLVGGSSQATPLKGTFRLPEAR